MATVLIQRGETEGAGGLGDRSCRSRASSRNVMARSGVEFDDGEQSPVREGGARTGDCRLLPIFVLLAVCLRPILEGGSSCGQFGPRSSQCCVRPVRPPGRRMGRRHARRRARRGRTSVFLGATRCPLAPRAGVYLEEIWNDRGQVRYQELAGQHQEVPGLASKGGGEQPPRRLQEPPRQDTEVGPAVPVTQLAPAGKPLRANTGEADTAASARAATTNFCLPSQRLQKDAAGAQGELHARKYKYSRGSVVWKRRSCGSEVQDADKYFQETKLWCAPYL